MSDTAIVIDDGTTISLPDKIHIGILCSENEPSFVIIGFTKNKAYIFGGSTEKTRTLALNILQCADDADRENGVFSPKKTENTIRKYLAEIKAS